MNEGEVNTHAKKVQFARIWLSGLVTESDGIHRRKRLEEDSSQDKMCRQALAQLLVDGEAPREILDFLATLIAPNSDVSPKEGLRAIGGQLFRSGDTRTDMALTGSDEVLRLARRDRRRYSDGNLNGSIILLVREQLDVGLSLEQAFFKVSKHAETAGVKKMSPRNVKKIWSDSKRLRDKLFSPVARIGKDTL